MKKCLIECNSLHQDADVSQRAVRGSGDVITGQDERTIRSSIQSRGDPGLEFQRADPGPVSPSRLKCLTK